MLHPLEKKSSCNLGCDKHPNDMAHEVFRYLEFEVSLKYLTLVPQKTLAPGEEAPVWLFVETSVSMLLVGSFTFLIEGCFSSSGYPSDGGVPFSKHDPQKGSRKGRFLTKRYFR